MASATLTPAPRESAVATTLRYLYFMRFSVMLWLMFPALALLDWRGATAMTRGIVALASRQHLFFAAFFVAIAGWVALLAARITCAYGEERFGSAPPRWFAVGNQMSFWTFWAAQLPGFVLLGYVWYRTATEQKLHHLTIGLSLVAGVAAALLCWVLLAGIYYWMFWTGRPITGDAKAFVVPYGLFFARMETRPPSAPLLALLRLFERAAKLGPGYANPVRGEFKVHSGHALALLTLAFLATIYLAFWEFTAPVPLEKVKLAVRLILGIGALVWAALSLRAKRKSEKAFSIRDLLLMVVLFAPMLLGFSLPFAWENHPFAMPVLGFVTVLLMFVLWGLAGLAFFLDRFRVPVLTLLALCFFGLNILPIAGDHYLTTYDLPRDFSLPTPTEHLAMFEHAVGLRPVIVVTATGGGIHAAAWTSAVLNEMEQRFPGPGSFDSSILLMSTVSGGSVGVVPWLESYRSNASFTSNRQVEIAECPDLQAVAWGMTYADFLRVLFPIRISRLGKALNAYDRGWALQQAFWRNRQTGCGHQKFDPNRLEHRLSDFGLPSRYASDVSGESAYVPAFSLNTTIAETGSRLLVANYRVPRDGDNSEFSSADSFLERPARDLSLSSAARISANFPYVSPMPRVAPPAEGFHFGDGGYFDNDGTGTAMEFLWSAFKDWPARPAGMRVPVLLLEIRDGPDPSSAGDPEIPQSHWGLLRQAIGPLVTFYNANHVSITRRNRRELCFMEQALQNKAAFTHIVVPFQSCDSGRCAADPQPLSWQLTASQEKEIQTALTSIDGQIQAVANWYTAAKNGQSEAAQECIKDNISARNLAPNNSF